MQCSNYGLGILKLFEIWQDPWMAKRIHILWNSKKVSLKKNPPGNWFKMAFLYTKKDITTTHTKFEGTGKPSKYWDFPVLSLGILFVEMLNLANLVNPHKIQNVKNNTSTVDLKPIANAIIAGETLKDIKSAKESSSWPMSDDLFLKRATLPSKKSKKRPKQMKKRALWM